MLKNALFFFGLFLLTGCISSRKYNEMVLLKDHYKQEADQLKLVQQQKEELQQKLAEKEEKVRDTRDQLAKLSGRFVQLEEGNTDLSDRYDQLLKEHQEMIRQSELEERRLLDSIQFLHGHIEEKNTEIRRLQLEYTEDPAEADSLLEHLSLRELELREFRESRDREEKTLQELQEALAKSLRAWPDTVLGWRLENRQVQISLRNDWLFVDNGTELSAAGKKALRQVASRLRSAAGVEAHILHYTENAAPESIWELSLQRAVVVGKQLADYGLPKSRIHPRAQLSKSSPTPEEELTSQDRTLLWLQLPR